jgi:alpha,alpha-trehalase
MNLFELSPLFEDVQESEIFPDGKIFVDCIPKRNTTLILNEYITLKNNPPANFSLSRFVEENFELPQPPPALNNIRQEEDIVQHIKSLWSYLKRTGDVPIPGSTLLALPHPYIVPGGRFREIYYWDSYFTMLGLHECGETELICNMLDNFAFLIRTYGHIPNGNRSYYLSRSQPPFFTLMVELYASATHPSIWNNYIDVVEKEYAYWMSRPALTADMPVFKKTVALPDGNVLNRYHDTAFTPRPESYREDVKTAAKIKRPKEEVYNHLRSAAESGWDFSSRWLADDYDLSGIETGHIIPVDLNALLYYTEKTLASYFKNAGDSEKSTFYSAAAEKRWNAIQKYCFCETDGVYYDYHWKNKTLTRKFTPASLFPLWLSAIPAEKETKIGKAAAEKIKKDLLQQGGVLTSTITNNQQWDAPNGWAPLQWVTIMALEKTGQQELAFEIAQRWLKLNEDVYYRTGKLMEKYNVVDTHLEAGGGEYEGQDGFGWTNGVYLALKKKYPVSSDI